jgi:NAD(P) transhydrogenase
VGSEYEIAIVGSGPGGLKAAMQAAKLHKRAVVIDRGPMLGGVSTNTGTIPSKTLREVILYLTGLEHRDIYGPAFRVKEDLTFDDLRARMEQVIDTERGVVRDQLLRNHVDVLDGTASFAGPGELAVASTDGERRISAGRIVLAPGSRPTRPVGVEFNDRTVLDSDGILHI